MKAFYFVIFIGVLLCSCRRDKALPSTYISCCRDTDTTISTSTPYDPPAPVHVVIDTTVAGRRFLVSSGVRDSICKFYVQYNGGWDSFSSDRLTDTFVDGGMLYYEDTLAVYRGYKFLNDSMVAICFPYGRYVWVLYQAQSVGMKRVSGGVLVGPFPVYIDMDRRRIITVELAIEHDIMDTTLSDPFTVYDYLHDRRWIAPWRKWMILKGDDMRKFYDQI